MTACDVITPDRHDPAATTRRMRAACGTAADRLWRDRLRLSRDALRTLGHDAAMLAAIAVALLIL